MSRPLERLRHALQAGASTQVGIGPMSRNCVEAVIEVANAERVPLMLIASRRQIECAAQGGGYVNRWSTEEFARFVRERDHGGFVVLCRDHGGPWQSTAEVEQRLPLREAMASAKTSVEADVSAGFDIIHLDPSVDIHEPQLGHAVVLERLRELYEHCMQVARREGSEIGVEMGSEEQSGVDQDLGVLEAALEFMHRFCQERSFPAPTFVVGQTGTLVRETANVGSFDDPFRRNGAVPAEILVPRLLEACAHHGVYLKEHNADYLSDDALRWHPRLGIHAANFAPQFGVIETRHILWLCGQFQLRREAERFLELALDSGKWKKWMQPRSAATDYERAVVAGHYVFGREEFRDLIGSVRRACASHGLDLDASIREALKAAALRIMRCFNLVNS